MKIQDIFAASLKIRNELKSKSDYVVNPIDLSLPPVLPYRISDDIKLIIIGQDPTVKVQKSRKKIEYTLNLDKRGALRKYIKSICTELGIDFENIYVTNVFKYFYSYPPERTMDVIQHHLEKNLQLLKEEIEYYPSAVIITLGLPVLRLLTDAHSEVSNFWDYNKINKSTNGNYKY